MCPLFVNRPQETLPIFPPKPVTLCMGRIQTQLKCNIKLHSHNHVIMYFSKRPYRSKKKKKKIALLIAADIFKYIYIFYLKCFFLINSTV